MAFAFEVDLESLEEETEETGLAYESFLDEEDFFALGIDPGLPTEAKPGSEQKVLMLAARYAAGLPLWHNDDRYDHGPAALSGIDFMSEPGTAEETED